MSETADVLKIVRATLEALVHDDHDERITLNGGSRQRLHATLQAIGSHLQGDVPSDDAVAVRLALIAHGEGAPALEWREFMATAGVATAWYADVDGGFRVVVHLNSGDRYVWEFGVAWGHRGVRRVAFDVRGEPSLVRAQLAAEAAALRIARFMMRSLVPV